jgi:hypothetical protein
MDKQRFILIDDLRKERAAQAVLSAPKGYVVEIKPPKRSEEQSAHFHAICNDIAKSGLKWAGKARTPPEWKRLLVSAHAVATEEPSEFVAGIEGEVVNVRESTALMSVSRASSLIEYSIAFATSKGVVLHDRYGGYEG